MSERGTLREQGRRWTISKRLDSLCHLWSIYIISFSSTKPINLNTGDTSLSTRSQGMKQMVCYTSSLTSIRLFERPRKGWATKWLTLLRR